MTQTNPSSQIEDEVVALADALFEDRISDDQSRRLEHLVVSRPELAEIYAGYTHLWCALPLHVVPLATPLLELAESHQEREPLTPGDSMIVPAIRVVAEKDRSIAAPGMRIAKEADPSAAPVPGVRNGKRAGRGFSPGWRWAAAASILLAVGVGGIVAWWARPGASRAATLVETADAQWVGAPADAGKILLTGNHVRLSSGLARIVFDGGATVILDGPADLRIDGRGQAELESGKLTATVPGPARGFAVQTPSSRVVDLGTEFGLLVDAAGNTETHVLKGRVDVLPIHAASATHLAANSALRVSADGLTAQQIACRNGDFIQTIPAIDLADVVAGGNGTQRHRNSGIDMTNGSVVRAPADADITEFNRLSDRSGDGKFHACPERPGIAGVFIPQGNTPGDVLDPAGDRFKFPSTENLSYYYFWAGGGVPLPPELGGHGRTTIGGMDYDSPAHALLVMHANKGVTFDLQRIRQIQPGRPFGYFRAIGVNPYTRAPANVRAEFWVLIDGKLQFHQSVLALAPPFEVNVAIPATAHYLTLVTTDGGVGRNYKWVTLGDPRLE